MKQSNKSLILKICICGMMAAISIVIDILSIRSNFTKVTLYALPLLLTSILFDYKYGILVGFVEGFLSQIFLYGLTITTPLWMLAPIIWGSCSGILYKIFNKLNEKINILLTVLITSIVVLIVNSGVSILDGIIMNYSYAYVFTNLLARFITSIVTTAIYYLILIILIPRLRKTIKI